MTQTPQTTHTTPRELATVAEVCARYRVHADSVREACRLGRIPFYRVGTVYRFDLDVLDDLFRRDGTHTDAYLPLTITRPSRRRPPVPAREESPPAA